MKDREFFALGNLAIDDLVYVDGTTRWCLPGGGALYAALGMALWTQSAELVSVLGPDYPRAAFAARVGFDRCRGVAASMRNWGLYEDDGTRHFLSRRRSADWPTYSPVPGDLRAESYRNCHLAPMPWAHLAPLASALRERDAGLISLDVHDRELASIAPAALLSLLRAVDVFLPSRQDTDVIAPGSTPLEALQMLRRAGVRTPVLGVKCGPDGALVHAVDAHEYIRVPSAADDVVDVTGAGDAFCGGFLAGLARSADVGEAMLCGSISAALALAAVGPFALAAATGAEAQQRLDALRPQLVRRPFLI